MPVKPVTQEQAQQIIELLKQIAKSVKDTEGWMGYLCVAKDERPSVTKRQKKG